MTGRTTPMLPHEAVFADAIGTEILARAYHPALFESLGFRRFDDGRQALMGADLGMGPR